MDTCCSGLSCLKLVFWPCQPFWTCAFDSSNCESLRIASNEIQQVSFYRKESTWMPEYKLEAQTKQRQMSRISLPASTHLGERVVPMHSQGALLLISYTVVTGSKIVHFCRSLKLVREILVHLWRSSLYLWLRIKVICFLVFIFRRSI